MNIQNRKMTKQVAFLLVGITLSFTVSVSSRAALIPVDDPLFGPASITADTATDLQWLDLTQTTNLSHLQMDSLIASDMRFVGWRYASGSEVASLFTDAGICFCYSAENIDPVSNLQSLLGVTSTARGAPGSPDLVLITSSGFYGPVNFSIRPPQATHALFDIQFLPSGITVAGVQGLRPDFTQPWDFASPGIGSFLVRAAVPAIPEPSSGILLLVGLAAVGRYSARLRSPSCPDKYTNLVAHPRT